MCGSYPNPVGISIRELSVGDQIIVLAGEGDPEFDRDRVDIVWKVSGFSALTAGGVSINCLNISKVVLTGNHFDSFLASDKAKAVWQEILDSNEATVFTPDPE